MKEKIQRFFYGRNGSDDLSRFITLLGTILWLLGMLTFSVFSSMGLAIYIYGLYRMFSRNLYKRSMENNAYLKLRGRGRGWLLGRKNRFVQRKVYRFYNCPSCKQAVRVPKGKGKISITCPCCHGQFIRKS